MPDDKRSRDKQARDSDRRQRERDVLAALERWDETEPPTEDRELDAVESELEEVAFPASGSEVVAAVGDREVEAPDATYTVAELVPETDAVEFESPAEVRVRVQRPTVAAAVKRIVEASGTIPQVDLGGSQREAYEKTLRALKDIEADDDDEGIRTVTDWIVERIREKEKLPGSRDVRRQAAKFCREQGYQIRNDEWLGV